MRYLVLIIRFLIAMVWLVNGLICKVLMLVPRHHEIVSRILGDEHAVLLTRGIGLGEIGIALWVVSGIKSRLCAIFQMVLVATMNLLEFVIARDLLLWGGMNAVYATLFIAFVGWHEFVLKKKVKSREGSPGQGTLSR
mgnify:CR=1 FL=1